MTKLNEERVAVANAVLALFMPGTRLYYSEKERLRMQWNTLREGGPRHDFSAKLRSDGSWPKYGYNVRPSGGTGFQALAQLIRYVRDWHRLPLLTWEYWGGDSVKLFDDQSLVNLLREGNYGDPAKVCCVLCGTVEHKRGLDWWSLNGVTGPSCFGGLCTPDHYSVKAYAKPVFGVAA